MKKVVGVLAALLLSSSVMASEEAEKRAIYCKAMESNQTAQADLYTSFSIKFYLTSSADYKACRKMAAEDDGARVIIDPDA